MALNPPEAETREAFDLANAYIASGYGHLNLPTVSNARDLGGLPAAEGKVIQAGRLIRTSALHKAHDADLARLAALNVRYVVDFRSTDERTRSQDRLDGIPGATVVILPVIPEDESGAGVEAPQSPLAMLEEFREFDDNPLGRMASLYRTMVLSDSGKAAFKGFFDTLLGCEEGAVLWHCSAGKDRTGLAAAFLETVLGVPEDLIMEDYLASNRYTEAPFMAWLHHIVPDGLEPKLLEMAHVMGTVSEHSLRAALDAVEATYGSVSAYIEDALGVDAEKTARLRELYLTDPVR